MRDQVREGSRRAVRSAYRSARAVKRRLFESSALLRQLRYESTNAGEFASLFAHEKMLSDRKRMAAYHDHLAELVPSGAVVVDLGTGTGVLAAWAARNASKVYALEHSAPMAALAEAILAANGVANVEVVRGHSSSFTPPEPVDVIVHEQMGSFLIDEAMILNVLDLRDRLLAPGGRILPNLFSLFVEPVSLDDELRVPLLWEQSQLGIDLSFLAGRPEAVPAGLDRILVPFGHVAEVLTEPEPVWRFDLEQVTAADVPAALEVRRTIARPGRLDGLAMWFEAGTREGVWLSTHPAVRQKAWPTPLQRLPGRPVEAADQLAYTVHLTPDAVGDITVEA